MQYRILKIDNYFFIQTRDSKSVNKAWQILTDTPFKEIEAAKAVIKLHDYTNIGTFDFDVEVVYNL